jgi:hypothetical protein
MLPGTAQYIAATPGRISEPIRTFCAEISASPPVFLRVTADTGANLGSCYEITAQRAEKIGGEVVYGWIISELPGVYLTAEHHAVVAKDGWFIDRIPQSKDDARTLFLPDAEIGLPQPRPANRYFPLSHDLRIVRAIRLLSRNSQLELEGRLLSAEFLRNNREFDRLVELVFAGQRRGRDRKGQNSKRRRRKA